MDTKQIISFMKVYELRSINAAAKSLYISTQGLSKIIQKMETELDVALFIRQPSGVVPTVYADHLYQHGQAIVDEIKAICNEKETVAQKELLVGCTSGILRILSLKFLYDFREQYPSIPLCLYDNTDRTLEKMIQEEEIGLCILSGPVDPLKYNISFFLSCEVCVVTNIHNPLAKLPEVRMKDLENEPLIISSREYHVYQKRYNAMMRMDSRPNVVLETMDIDLHAISASQGYASALMLNLPEFVGNYPNIKVIPFSPDDRSFWDTYLVSKRDRELTTDEKIFLDFAHHWIRKNRPELT